MAKINNFASSLRAAIYRASDHYSEDNPPMKADMVYDFRLRRLPKQSSI